MGNCFMLELMNKRYIRTFTEDIKLCLIKASVIQIKQISQS